MNLNKKTNTIESSFIVAYDVDDTLVLWTHDGQNTIAVPSEWGITENLQPNLTMIRQLKKDFHNGRFILVWSQGGHNWCNAVVRALGLENYVGLTMTKPSRFYDDLPPSAWTNHVLPDGVMVDGEEVDDAPNS